MRVNQVYLPSCIQPDWAMAAAWFFRLRTPPILSPNDTSHQSAGKCRQGGAPQSPFPQNHRRKEKVRQRQTKKIRRERERKAEKSRNETHPVLETALLRPLPFTQNSSGGPWPPSPPSSEPSPPASPRGGMVTIFPPSFSEGRTAPLWLLSHPRRVRPFWAPWDVSTRRGNPRPSTFLDLGPPGRAVHDQVMAGLPALVG